jgi:hypothetical protein
MAAIHKTAMGNSIDMDMLRLANEGVIAVGNMRTNARGDELGPGGKIVKTRAQLMTEYHQLHTPTADQSIPGESAADTPLEEVFNMAPMVDSPSAPVAEDVVPAESQTNKPRGSFADAVAKQTEVNQELLTPPAPGAGGIQRI